MTLFALCEGNPAVSGGFLQAITWINVDPCSRYMNTQPEGVPEPLKNGGLLWQKEYVPPGP